MSKQVKQLTQKEKREVVKGRLRIAPELSDRAVARMVGVSPTTVGKVRKEITNKTVQTGQVDIDNNWINHPYLKANPEILEGINVKSLRVLKAEGVLDKMAERNSKSPRYCQQILYKERKEANKSPAITVTEEDVNIFVGDVKTGLPQIEDESVDVLFTDPPYNGRAVQNLYSHIASVAGRVLADGGSLAVMCGGAHLDLAFKELGTDKRLKFNWDIAYISRLGGLPLIHNRKVYTSVKHILWFVKGKYEGGNVYDLIEAPPDPKNTDKAHHHWGQSVEGVKKVLHKISKDGDVVCDIMCGGGSTVVAALELGGRKVIACDIDEEAVKTTSRRVAKLFGAR